jgi:hypothetical protein
MPKPLSSQDIPLANFTSLLDYKPRVGDVVYLSGWFSNQVGIVSGYDAKTDNLSIIYSTVPLVLLTFNQQEQSKRTETRQLGDIKNAAKGKYAFYQHNPELNTTVWYV